MRFGDRCTAGAWWGILLVLVFCIASEARVGVQFVRKDVVTLEFRPMTARPLGDGPANPTLVVEDSDEARLEMDLAWPDASDRSHLVLVATRRFAGDGVATHVNIEAELTTPDGEITRATRKMGFREETTALFEVARLHGRMLTFAVAAEASHERVLSARPTVGRPVRLQLEILWTEGEQSVLLETNELNTFVGQPVSYSFSLGEADVAESVRLEILPGEVVGDVVRIDVDISASLPDPVQGILLMSRKERWLATRGTTSSLTLETGQPPRGFRFRVTPYF